MEENEDFKVVQDGIKSLLDTQNTSKKDIETLTERLNKMEALKGRSLKADHAPLGLTGAFASNIMAPENIENLEKFKRKDIKAFGFELKDMTFSGNFSSAAAAVATLQPGIVAPPPKPMHLIDIVPGVSSYTRDYVYVREDSVTGGPSMIPEGSIKPQVSFNLSQQTATTQYLAVTTTISNQFLLDVDGMIDYLQRRLLQLLLDQLDTQIMSGTGISPNLSGFHTSGNNTAATGGATIDPEQLIQAIGQLAALNRNATAIILNPADFYSTILLNKASTAGLYSLPPSYVTTPDGMIRAANVPIYWNTAQTSGKFDVVDMSGVRLVMREPPRIEFFVDSVMAAANKTFVRAELRCALVIEGATYDIFGSF